MHLANPFPRVRRRATFALLGVLLTASALGLTQCRMIDERLTGVSLDCARPDKCVTKCNKDLVDGTAHEIFLHLKNVHACDRDSVCIALENVRFVNALKQLQLDHRACLANCHHQGAGGGGR